MWGYIQSVLGRPYRWGGDDPGRGYDCSGFVQDALRCVGIDPPGDQTSYALYKFFASNKNGSRVETKFGTLLFFGNENRVRHVSIALNKFSMVEAGGGGSFSVGDIEASKNLVSKFMKSLRVNHSKEYEDDLSEALDSIVCASKAYRKGAYIRIVPITRRNDLVASIYPNGLDEEDS